MQLPKHVSWTKEKEEATTLWNTYVEVVLSSDGPASNHNIVVDHMLWRETKSKPDPPCCVNIYCKIQPIEGLVVHPRYVKIPIVERHSRYIGAIYESWRITKLGLGDVETSHEC